MKIQLTLTTAEKGPDYHFNYEMLDRTDLAEFLERFAQTAQPGDTLKITDFLA